MNILILAAGDGTRWGDYLGVPKHLVPLPDGDFLLQRTVRQFSGHGQVTVVGRDHRYLLPGAALCVPADCSDDLDAARFTSSWDFWRTDQRNLLVWGDVWFSDKAVLTITAPVADWRWYARFDPSALTGCPWGEGFALSFPGKMVERVRQAVNSLIAGARAGTNINSQGWGLFRTLSGGNPDIHARYPNMVEINDWTDDFDFPVDYDRWIKRRI